LRDNGAVLGGFAFDRRRGDFTNRDKRVLEVLLPHLVQAARRGRPNGGSQLTAREREIVAWVARGKTNREVAAQLSLSAGTVRKHLDNIYAKLDVPNRAAAVSLMHDGK
jgi:DNA-binding CsgD family transcriptional regulator